MGIFYTILTTVVLLALLLIILICLPLFFELRIHRQGKISGSLDIAFFYGIIKIRAEKKEQGTILCVKIFGRVIMDDLAKNRKVNCDGKVEANQVKKTETKTTEGLERSEKQGKPEKAEQTEQEKQTETAEVKEKSAGNKMWEVLKENEGFVACTIKFIRRMIKSFAITYISGNGRLSVEDPTYYGYVWAVFSMIKPYAEENLDLDIEFDRYDFQGEIVIEAKLSAIKILHSVILYLLSKPIRSIVYKLIIRKDEAYGI